MGRSADVFGRPVRVAAVRRPARDSGIRTNDAIAAATAALRLARSSRADDADALAVVAGFSPLALAAFVHSGLFATRLTCEPAWVAAFPVFAFSGLAGACLPGALHVLTSSRR